jgi:signal peptidase I
MNWSDLQEKAFEKLSWVFDFSKVVVILVILILFLHFFIATIFVVSGQSMEPNFHDGQYLLINQLSRSNLQRGDVVGLKYPGQPSEKYIKRIIGLPGEKIKIKNNQIIIYDKNHPIGFVLPEKTYISSETMTEGDKTWQLGQDEYFVIGDNRENSSDSRTWGALSSRYIVGRAIFILWPITQINKILRQDYLII